MGVQGRLFDTGAYRRRVAKMERPGRWSMHATAARAALVYTLKPSFGSFVAYVEAIWSKDQHTNDTTEQIADALSVEERTIKRHLAEARRLGIIEARSVRQDGRQRRVLVPGPRMRESAEIAPPERRSGVTGSVTLGGQDRSPQGDRIGHPRVTGSVTHQRGVENRKGEKGAAPPVCAQCNEPLDPVDDTDNDGRYWPRCRNCAFGHRADMSDEALMDRVWGPALNS